MKTRSMKNILLATLFLFTCQILNPTWTHAETPIPEKKSVHDFLFSDFGAINTHSMETHTLPKRVALTALVLEGRKRGWISPNSNDYKTVLEKFGFMTPTSIANAPASYQARFKDLPLGLTEKEIRLGLPVLEVTGLNVTCSTCHTGRLYDAQGTPTSQVWLGLPNTSINLELYTQSVYSGLKDARRDFSSFHRLMKRLFPDTEFRELATLKTIVYKIVNKRIRHLEETVDQPVPYSNGGPGLTNGVGALKYTLNLFDRDRLQPEFGFTSIPSLGDRFLRSSLLYDGVYTAPGSPRFIEKTSWSPRDEQKLNAIAASFTIPTMGQSVKGALAGTSHVHRVLHDIIGTYEAPPFPGKVDFETAQRGGHIYTQSCARCHGAYEWQGPKPVLRSYPNRLVPQNEMQTDPARWQAITPELLVGITTSDLSKVIRPARTGGYVAPLLNSLWATAPYLHNGSVPTLWDLMHPQERPEKFLVGGHSLDYEKMGLQLQWDASKDAWVYPHTVKAWSLPALYDTRKPGHSNKGHESPFHLLSENEKADLLEYLKLL